MPPGARRDLWLLILGEGALIGAAWLLGWLCGQRPDEELRWTTQAAGWGVAATLPMLVVFVGLIACSWPAVRAIREFCEVVLVPLLAKASLPELVVLATLAGFGEELLFRGVVQPLFARWMPFWPALLAGNLLFGLLHPITKLYVVLAFGFGVYLSLLLLWTGDLLAPIIAHGLYDFLALVYLLRKPPRS